MVRESLRAPREPSGSWTPRVAPLFPLPHVFLFPGCVMPLHIFERRYRQMIEDLLDGPGQLVVGTVQKGPDAELAAVPPVRSVAGIGEICRHERLPDGRFLIWLFGLSRVRILRETSSDRLYRCVAIEPLLEVAPPKEREPKLRERLRRAIRARCSRSTKIPDEISISCLADLLLQRIGLPQSELEILYEEMDVETRAECGLELHAHRASPSRDSKRRK